MSLRVDQIDLVGARRSFRFEPGFNLIAGPITSGKTTLIRCIQGLLGSSLSNIPREASTTVSSLAGELTLRESHAHVVRPFVTTANAMVEVAMGSHAWRLPAMRATSLEPLTYGAWLLGQLGLPVLRVPSAPTRPESDSVPLSINDFLSYCYLNQTELDSSVFGHTDHFRNIKRKYVFEVLYGKYNVEVATLHDRRRELSRERQRLRDQTENVEEFLGGSALSNRASLREQLKEVESSITRASQTATEFADRVTNLSGTENLRSQILRLDQEISDLEGKLQFESKSVESMESLLAQLDTQRVRLTRAIVANDLVGAMDFISCPRCGTALDVARVDEPACYVCLQEPSPQLEREDFIRELDRIGRQSTETRQLIESHMLAVREIGLRIEASRAARDSAARELDIRTRAYVSEQAETIAATERERTRLNAERERLEEYLRLFERLEASAARQAQLSEELTSVETQIEGLVSATSDYQERVAYLEARFQEGLERMEVPRFADAGRTGIDANTYLPMMDGRRFDELHSLGLIGIVNIAHAVAHHLTAQAFDIPLPGFLIVDGISSNLGYRGADAIRIEAVYEYLLNVSASGEGGLQIIAADNTVPDSFRGHVKAQFSSEEKLIPRDLLESE